MQMMTLLGFRTQLFFFFLLEQYTRTKASHCLVTAELDWVSKTNKQNKTEEEDRERKQSLMLPSN